MPDSVLPTSTLRAPALLDAAGAAALVASYAAVSVTAAVKDIGRIDVHMRKFISLSPICLVATADASGKQDVTPRGDPPGSFVVFDEHTIAIADRPGNNRLDTLKNLLENPEIALIFLLPGTNETVRVAGTARLSVDPELLASMAVQGKEPKCAIVVSVRQAYLHCAKALLRSRLWTGDYAQPKGTFPSISRMVGDQIGLSEEEKKKREAATEIAYRDGLWAPIK
jgi:PPOX class probable FMN-dependent enzyme